jgi:cation diffusion facilitator family transporter
LFGKQLLLLFEERDILYIPRFSWLFPAGAIIALEISYQFMKRAAKKADSPALVAEAIHYRLDSLTSFLALSSLYAAATWPDFSFLIDHSGALAIAVGMIGMGLYAARDNFHQLMDRVPESHLFECVRQAAFKTPGVEATEKIRIQKYGPDAHVDIDIEVKPGLSVDLAHKISQQVRVEIQKAWPSVQDVTVHIEPYYANDH